MSKIKKGEYKLEFYNKKVLNMVSQKFEVKHFWRITAANNEVAHKSEQGFVSEQGAKDNLILLASLLDSLQRVVKLLGLSERVNLAQEIDEKFNIYDKKFMPACSRDTLGVITALQVSGYEIRKID